MESAGSVGDFYVEEISLSEHLKQISQAGSVEVVIESWITERSQLFLDLENEESSDSIESSPYEKPKFLTQLDDVSQLNVDGKHVFKCHFTGFPLPEVEWSIDGQLLEITRSVQQHVQSHLIFAET